MFQLLIGFEVVVHRVACPELCEPSSWSFASALALLIDQGLPGCIIPKSYPRVGGEVIGTDRAVLWSAGEIE